jgi:hypothetical protein
VDAEKFAALRLKFFRHLPPLLSAFLYYIRFCGISQVIFPFLTTIFQFFAAFL